MTRRKPEEKKNDYHLWQHEKIRQYRSFELILLDIAIPEEDFDYYTKPQKCCIARVHFEFMRLEKAADRRQHYNIFATIIAFLARSESSKIHRAELVIYLLSLSSSRNCLFPSRTILSEAIFY